jgi:hypothetical protein
MAVSISKSILLILISTLTVSLNIHGYMLEMEITRGIIWYRTHGILLWTFRDFCLNTILAGDGICISDETDDSSLANLFGIINRSLIMWWWVQNSLNGTNASTPSDKIKSLCEGYHIDNELDHARLLTYTSETIDLWRKGWGTKNGKRSILWWVSQASSNQPSTGSPSCSSR